MKTPVDKQLIRRSSLAGVMLIIVAALVLEATSLIQFYFSRKGLREEASLRAESQLEITKAHIIDIIDQAEASVRNSEWIAEWCLNNIDSLPSVCRRIVESNDVVMGSSVAMLPGYNKKYPLYAPYACLDDEGKILIKSLATDEYDYPSQEWFLKPIERNGGYWSEPYMDEGGGEAMMTTFSMPVKDTSGSIAAVITADISLSWLSSLMRIGEVEVYPHAFSLLFSRSGNIMVSPVKEFIMNRTIWEMGGEMDSPHEADAIISSLLGGDSGHSTITYKGEKFHLYYEPVERSGWTMGMVIPDAEIYGDLKRLFLMVTLLQLLGLLMLVLILRAAARNQKKYMSVSESKERIENELKIASAIQMSMIPKTFPPFPERKDIDMAAAILPAKEVGGDLYDFFIRDEKLYFCIGDVSGKGVPAALVMAVTRSLFRAVSTHETNPGVIVSSMNDSMADMNESNMFVTFFCGILDLANGRFRYCNAGHNSPVILSDSKEILRTESNVPLGIMRGYSFIEQETALEADDALFLYTDGVTEAENGHHELFGEERMLHALSGKRPSREHLQKISENIREFVGDADQSDDITMLFIHYLK